MNDQNRRSVDENMERLKQAQSDTGAEGTKTAFGITGMIIGTTVAIIVIFLVVWLLF